MCARSFFLLFPSSLAARVNFDLKACTPGAKKEEEEVLVVDSERSGEEVEAKEQKKRTQGIKKEIVLSQLRLLDPVSLVSARIEFLLIL